MKASPRLVVFGATGRTGGVLAARLAHGGYPVRIMARDAATARTLLDPRIEVLQGDLGSTTAIAAAVAGAAAILFTASAGGYRDGRPRDVDFAGVARVADAGLEAGCGHMVLLSSASVTQPEHPHNCTFNSVLKWKQRGEAHLRASGLPYTIVRALGLRDRPGGLSGVRMVQGDRLAFGEDIARADVASFLADVVCANLALDGWSLPPGGGEPAFAPRFDKASLLGATLEIYNDGRISAETWSSRLDRLAADPAVLSVTSSVHE